MAKALLLCLGLAVIASILVTSDAAMCNGHPKPNPQPNLNPIYTGAPQFIRQTKNAKLFMGGGSNAPFRIVHVWGSAYEMGYAQGQILREELIDFITGVWTHLDAAFDTQTPAWVPKWLADDIAYYGLNFLLQLTADATEPFTPDYWFEELHGLVDAINHPNVTFESTMHVMLLGELTRGTCSMFGAWGDAVQNAGTKLLQLRALDWDNEGPFAKYPAIIVYHPNEGHPFANIGWIGWIGSITGISSQQMAISEIGVAFPDDSWGDQSRFGYPFTYILRDILQFDNTVDDAITRLQNADRTCYLLFGVGDGKLTEFRGFQYSYSVLNVFDDTNLEPDNSTWHPRMKDIVYWGMDWLCPSYNSILNQQLEKFYGNLTPENTIKYILPTVQTGDTHIAIYDLTNMQLYYAFAGPENTTNRNGYQRPFTQLDMIKIFSEPKPNL